MTQLGYTQTGANNLVSELNDYIRTKGLPYFALDGRIIDEIGVVGRDKNGVSKVEYGHTTAWADVSTPDSDGVYFMPSVECMRGIWADKYLDGPPELEIPGILELEAIKAAELGLELVEYTRPVSEEI